MQKKKKKYIQIVTLRLKCLNFSLLNNRYGFKKSPLKFDGRSVSHLACLKGQQSKQTLGFFFKNLHN